jgi:predicted enzyme related to lactoylglutathione lyase
MLKDSQTFSGFSVNDIATAKKFYQDVLGLEVDQNEMGLELKLKNGNNIFIYEKDDHQPATFTILNFIVEDINAAVDQLVTDGVSFEHYEGMPAEQDERGVLRGLAAKQGPDIAWFKDPAGNILGLLQTS